MASRFLALLPPTVLGAMLAFPGSALAQPMNAADSPCQGVVTTAEMAQCFSKASKAADKDLNDTYGRIMRFLDIEGREADREALRKAQRLWIPYRDAACDAMRQLYGSGTAAPVNQLACQYYQTKARIEDLRTGYGWLLEKFGQPL